MTVQTIISLIFVIIILAIGLAIMISKYNGEKKKNKELTISEFISKYGINVINLLKDCYLIIKDQSFEDEDALIRKLVSLSSSIIRDQFEDYEIDTGVIDLLSDDLILEILNNVIISAKNEIIKSVPIKEEINIEEVPLYDSLEEPVEENEEVEIEEVSKEEAKEMIDIGDEIIKNINDNSSRYPEYNSDTIDL